MTITEENARVRAAYLDIIETAMRKAGVKRVEFEDKAYDREQDKVQFTFDGQKVTLAEIAMPSLDTMQLPMVVICKKSKEPRGLVADIVWLQIKTMRRIAYELYDWVRGEDWEDFEVVERDTIANFLDSWN